MGITGSSAWSTAVTCVRNAAARSADEVPRDSSASARATASLRQPMAPQSPPEAPKSCMSVPVGSGTVA